jgi:hypothetical protein
LNKDVILICVSDLHCGSTVGLYPPGFKLEEGGEVKLNKVQAQLWDWWRVFWDEFLPPLCKGRQRVIVCNGDAVEGDRNPVGLTAPNMADQRKMAVALLSTEIKKQDMAYLIRGTEAHVGGSGGHEESIAEALDLPLDPLTQQYSIYHFWKKVNGVLFSIAHHIGVSQSPVSEATALTTELVKAMKEAGRWGGEMPDVLVRSHRHMAAGVILPGKGGLHECFVTPGWQAKTPFLWRIDRMTLPQIGGVVYLVDADGTRSRREFVRILPQPKAEELWPMKG